MIKNFKDWNNHNSMRINEDKGKILSKTAEWLLKTIAGASKKTADELVDGGFKGIKGGVVKRLLNVSSDEVAKMERGLSEIVELRKAPWWQSMSKESRKIAEKEGEEIAVKFISAYHKGDEALLNAARSSSKAYMKKMKDIEVLQKEKDKLASFIDDQVPGRKMRDTLKTKLDDAQKNIDDAVKSGDAEKLARARKYVEETKDYVRQAGKQADYTGYSTRYRTKGIFGSRMEEGSDITDDVLNTIKEEGKEGVLTRLKKYLFNRGKNNVKDLSGKSESKSGGSLWSNLKSGIKTAMWIGAVLYGGSMAWNYMKDEEQSKATSTIKSSLKEIEQKFADEGISVTEVDGNVASFSQTFKIFFSGTNEDLPVEDAEVLKTMMNSDATISEFFAKTCQLSFEYPEKYFKENIDLFRSTSKFYSFLSELDKKLGVPKIISAVMDAEGMAAKSLEETFYEEGSPVSLDDYGYASYSNPNMKILLGSNEPVNMEGLLEESKDFLSMISMFKRKIMNDSVENSVIGALKNNGKITQEEFEERSSRIERELQKQLSEKEESFVAMTGMLMSYHSDYEPFTYFYKFNPEDLYETVDQVNLLMEESFELRSNNQLSRMYSALNYELSKFYEELGKERTLYGVLEYSGLGSIMRCIINLYALEDVCKIIVKDSLKEYQDSFTKTEIQEYQKVLKQIQSTEGKEQTVAVSGELDEETQAAIKEYQKKLGLPETGKPGEKSLKTMKDYLVSIITAKS